MSTDIERATALFKALEQAQASGKTLRTGLSLSLLAAIGLYMGHLYYRVTSFDTEAYMAELQTQASVKVWPVVEAELQAVSRDAEPALTKAFEQELSTILPRLSERLNSEGLLFQEDMAKAMRESLEKHFLSELNRNQGKLDVSLKEFQGDGQVYEDLMRRIEVAGRLWAMEQLDTTFAKHVKVLQSINESVAVLQKEAQATHAKTGTEHSVDDVMLLFVEIMNTRLEGGAQ